VTLTCGYVCARGAALLIFYCAIKQMVDSSHSRFAIVAEVRQERPKLSMAWPSRVWEHFGSVSE
jgi:hypothetical protein